MVDGKQAGDGVTGSAMGMDQPGEGALSGTRRKGDGFFVAFFAAMAVLMLGVLVLAWTSYQSSQFRHDMVMGLSGYPLARELRDSSYVVDGVIPGGTADNYRIVFSAMGSHGECAVESAVIVDCDWYSLQDARR